MLGVTVQNLVAFLGACQVDITLTLEGKMSFGKIRPLKKENICYICGRMDVVM